MSPQIAAGPLKKRNVATNATITKLLMKEQPFVLELGLKSLE